VTLRRAVFLDRDGVLNVARVKNGLPFPPASEVDVALYPDVVASCRALHDAGFFLIVVTNQPDIARGTTPRSTVDAIHEALAAQLPLDAIRMCPHDDADACACRKPKPGMLLEAAHEFDIDLRASFMVGDRWRDVAAGEMAGCVTFFLDRGYTERAPEKPDYTVDGLQAAAEIILATTQTKGRNR